MARITVPGLEHSCYSPVDWMRILRAGAYSSVGGITAPGLEQFIVATLKLIGCTKSRCLWKRGGRGDT